MTTDSDPNVARQPPGLTSFTIEGRVAPALFVVGWLASLLGLGMSIIGLAARGGLAGGVLFTAGLGVLTLGLVCAAGSQAIERRAAGVRGYAGPSPVLVFAPVLPLTFLLVILIGTPLVQLGLDPDGPVAVLISLCASAFAYALLIRLLVVGTGSLTWAEMGVRRPGPGVVEDIVWGAVLAVPMLFATSVVGLVLSQFLPIPPEVLPRPADPAGTALILLAAAIVAPIGEELFFRGFATTAWERLGGFRVALVRGSVFFAFAHVLTLGANSAAEGLGFAAFAFLVRLPVALALGWLFLRRRSLYGPIALHATFNGIPVLAVVAGAAGAAGAG